MTCWRITKCSVVAKFAGVIFVLGLFTCQEAPDHQGYTIYVAGTGLQPQGLSAHRAVYWKNGDEVPITNGPKDSGLNSITVEDSHIYVAGWESNVVFIEDILNYRRVAKFWKDGAAIKLGDENFESEATSILVEGGNVHVCGYEDGRACYWRNGIKIPLTLNTRVSTAREIAVNSRDVYLVGFEANPTAHTATYWKNGVPVSLTRGLAFSEASSISVDGEGNTHVVGVAYNGSEIVGKYWKNGIDVPISEGNKTWFNSVRVHQGNVYILGTLDDMPVVWKNGQAQFMDPDVTLTAMFINGNSIFTCGSVTVSRDPLLFTYAAWRDNTRLPSQQRLNSRGAAIFVTEK